MKLDTAQQLYESHGEALHGLSQAIATRLEQVTVADPEDASQIFGRKAADGSTPIVITPQRAKKANMFALFIGAMMAFVGIFLSQVPLINEYIAKPILFKPIGFVSYWPIMIILLGLGLYPLFALTILSLFAFSSASVLILSLSSFS